MAFDLIRINDLRNLTNCEIAPHTGLNLIKGENGSGKTSLLEAIYILGRGRSFRDKQISNAVQRGKSSFTVFGKKGSNFNKSAIGVSCSKKGTNLSIDGEKISKLSLLAKETPIHIVTPKSQELIEDGSSVRRRFLDWGVFHVEPLYQQFSFRYQRALSQRNKSLRESWKTANIWNKELHESGSKIQEYREIYFERLKEQLLIQMEMLEVKYDLEVAFYQGWPKEQTIKKMLDDGMAGDKNRKFTRMGPHRADINFKIKSDKFNKWGSRGHLKLVVFALFFAQANVIKSITNKETILLVDDLTAELDEKNVERVIAHMINQKNQTFFTTTDYRLCIERNVGKMFHVEHGVVS